MMTSRTSQPRHPASLDEAELLRQCSIDTYRASGPGGQHRNKTDSAVRISHQPTGITAAASERREQPVNKRVALKRLRVNLALEVRGYHDILNEPTDLWRSRAVGGRIAVNPKHADFPALLAELLDVLEQKNWEPRRAGLLLDVSTSQIIKLLKTEPRALAMVNDKRKAAGRHPLK